VGIDRRLGCLPVCGTSAAARQAADHWVLQPEHFVSANPWDQIKSLGGKLGLEVSTLQVRRTEDIAPAFAVLKDHPNVLNVCGDPLITTNLVRVIE
jgi:hypothetical protein